ncbi:MAG: GT4 family glycosyltransferase PelF [Treponema sp.]|nr:GT4 family glycosyltransferase PelF [Treponema sp.]
MRVCLLIEGSYPFITGGVSSWTQDLITSLPAVEFSLFTISPTKNQTRKYVLPPNVKEHVDVILGEERESSGRPGHGAAILRILRNIRDRSPNVAISDIVELLGLLPEGFNPMNRALESQVFWDILVELNRRHNPMYPFTDFFWAWKAAFSMIFTMLSVAPPEADIYHAISTGYAGLVGTAAKLRRGKPFLLTYQGLYHKEREIELRRASFIKGYQRDLWISVYHFLSRLAYQSADYSTSLFEYNRRIQIELGAREDRALVIPNGIDIPRFSSVVRARRPGFHVGLVGRVVPIKDIKTFITMARIVRHGIPEAEFHCIGPTDEDEGYFEECGRMVESFRLSEVFHFTGRQDVLEYYSFLDVMLLTSIREAQPLVILEAYAAGLPVASTRVGDVAGMLDNDERFLASPKDAEKLAEAVLWIYRNPEEAGKIVARRKKMVRERYDKEILYGTYGRLYSSIAEGTPWRA